MKKIVCCFNVIRLYDISANLATLQLAMTHATMVDL